MGKIKHFTHGLCPGTYKYQVRQYHFIEENIEDHRKCLACVWHSLNFIVIENIIYKCSGERVFGERNSSFVVYI